MNPEAAGRPRLRGFLATLVLALALVALAFLPLTGARAATQRLDDAPPDVNLAGHLSLLVDDTGQLTVEDLERLDAAGKLHPQPRHISAGFSRGAAWVAFTVERGPHGPVDWWLEVDPPVTDRIEVYLRRPGGELEVHRGGESVPVAQREKPWRSHVFRLKLTPETPQRIYVRIAGINTLYAQFHLWRPGAFDAARMADDLAEGAFGGILLVMVALALLTAVRTRLAVDAAYAFGLVTLTLWAGANRGFPQWLFAPASPTANDDVLTLALSLAPFALAWVATTLIVSTGTLATAGRLLTRATGATAVIFGLVSLSGLGRDHLLLPLNVQIVVFFAATLGFCVFAVVRRAEGARFFLLTFAPFLIWGGISSTSALGWWVGTFGRYALWQWVTISHVLLLQYAVATRTRALAVERTRLAREMTQAREEMARKSEEMARQTQFVRMLSHELRTPLTLIDHAAQLMKSGGPDTERHLERILAGGRQIGALLDASLTDGRLHSDWALALAPVSPRAVVEESVERARIRTEDHVLRTRFEGVAETARWDRHLIGLMLGTLLDNAIKYSPEGGSVQVEVVGEALPDGRPGLRIDVRDEGIGIAPEALPLIFERFYRAHTVGNIPGAGLGLTIARRIATLHEGTVTCRSTPGEGSVFTVRLPV